METINMKERRFAGLTIRTKNGPDGGSVGQDIQNVWTQFWNDHGSLVRGNVYGVYSNYESDRHGDYDVTAGIEIDAGANGTDGGDDVPDGLTEVIAPAGRYVVFHRKGTMPGVVQDTWQEIWDAFDAPEAPFQRAHLVDYEEYPSDQEVRIYVSVRG